MKSYDVVVLVPLRVPTVESSAAVAHVQALQTVERNVMERMPGMEIKVHSIEEIKDPYENQR